MRPQPTRRENGILLSQAVWEHGRSYGFVCVVTQVVFFLSNVWSAFHTCDDVFKDPFCVFYLGYDNLSNNSKNFTPLVH